MTQDRLQDSFLPHKYRQFVLGAFALLLLAIPATLAVEHGVDWIWAAALGISLLSPCVVSCSLNRRRTVSLIVSLVPFLLVTGGFLISDRLPHGDSNLIHFPIYEFVGQACV